VTPRQGYLPASDNLTVLSAVIDSMGASATGLRTSITVLNASLSAAAWAVTRVNASLPRTPAALASLSEPSLSLPVVTLYSASEALSIIARQPGGGGSAVVSGLRDDILAVASRVVAPRPQVSYELALTLAETVASVADAPQQLTDAQMFASLALIKR
jgi:hypothetical protein